MHVQRCCFANINLLHFCRSRCRRRLRCLSSLFIHRGLGLRFPCNDQTDEVNKLLYGLFSVFFFKVDFQHREKNTYSITLSDSSLTLSALAIGYFEVLSKWATKFHYLLTIFYCLFPSLTYFLLEIYRSSWNGKRGHF